MTDERLLNRARGGDEAAFLLLYERHRDGVFRFAYRLLGSTGLGEVITDEELSSEVQRAVESLPPLQREALVLFEFEELSLAEIAEVVGADVGAVKARLHRARQRLKRVLAPYLDSSRKPVVVEEAFNER